jgi:hypothetical protein
MSFEQVARVFFDNGVEVFVCRCEGVEGVGAEGRVQVRLGVGEDVKKDFWGKSIEVRHVGDLGELLWCCDENMWSVSTFRRYPCQALLTSVCWRVSPSTY